MKVVKSIALTNDESLNKHLLTCHKMTSELSHALLRSYVTRAITREELLMICDVYEVKRFARQYTNSISKNLFLIDVCCDEFLHSKWVSVRSELALLSYRLDVLMYDESDFVRKIVADTGYGLSKLIFDENESVRFAAKSYLNKIHQTDVNDELSKIE